MKGSSPARTWNEHRRRLLQALPGSDVRALCEPGLQEPNYANLCVMDMQKSSASCATVEPTEWWCWVSLVSWVGSHFDLVPLPGGRIGAKKIRLARYRNGGWVEESLVLCFSCSSSQ